MVGIIILRVSSDRKMIGHGLGDWDSILGRGRDFILLSPNCLAVSYGLLSNGYWKHFSMRKKRPEDEADHCPLCRARANNVTNSAVGIATGYGLDD
jgi:hypothetical protein